MSDGEEDYGEVERARTSVTKSSLTFLLEGVDPRDLAGDGISLISFTDSEAGGVREAPTCQELAIEGECLTKQGEHRQAIPLLEAALEQGTDDMQLRSVLWSLLGNAHFFVGDYQKAALCHMHDLAICYELGDERSQAQAYCNMGIANRKTGYLQRAKLCYERYLDICEKLEDGRSRSKAHHNLGDLELTLARLELQKEASRPEERAAATAHLNRAAEHFEKHLDYVKETSSRMAEAQAHASLGYIYELLRNTDKAIDHYEQRLRLALDLIDKGGEARSYCSIGNCLRATVQPEKALECYTRSLMIASELEDSIGEGVIHSNMAATYEMLCNLEETLVHQEKQLEAMQTAGSSLGEAMALDGMAKTLEYMGHLTQACATIEKLVIVRKNLRQDGEVIDCLSHLSVLREQVGEKPSRSASSAGAFKNTLKKMKPTGKKKRKRNTTAPELTVEALKNLKKEEQKDEGQKEEGGKEGGRWLFGRPLASKEKESTLQKKEADIPKGSPEISRATVPSIKEEDQQAEECLSSTEDTSLSQKSEPHFPDLPASRERANTLPSSISRSKTDTNINYQPNLSQHSLSPSIAEETFSTQSSFEAVPLEHLAPPSHGHGGASSGSSQGSPKLTVSSSSIRDEDGVEGNREEDEGGGEGGRYFHKGCPSLYENYGDEQHKLNLRHVMKFLEACSEPPVDLSVLLDWDGWALSSKELIIPQNKESQLI